MTMPTIHVKDLEGHPGMSRSVVVTGTLAGLATELVTIPESSVVAAELTLESVVEGIYVTGEISGSWSLRCARCLTEFEGTYAVNVGEMFAPDPDEDSDHYLLDPETGIDLEQLARDSIGVEMPFSPLCRPGCLGLCEVCGGNRNLGECPGHERTDPRFAVLSELLPQLTDDDR
jgi:uncharacterized protein